MVQKREKTEDAFLFVIVQRFAFFRQSADESTAPAVEALVRRHKVAKRAVKASGAKRLAPAEFLEIAGLLDAAGDPVEWVQHPHVFGGGRDDQSASGIKVMFFAFVVVRGFGDGRVLYSGDDHA
jgi:hypothetical protein